VADSSAGLRIIDISNIFQPVEVRFLALGSYVEAVTISGIHAYVANFANGLRVIDITDPIQPVESGYYHTVGYAYDVAVIEDTVYLANGYGSTYLLQNELLVPTYLLSVWRQNEQQQLLRISDALITGEESFTFTDAAAPAGTAEYRLQEIGRDGGENWFGPVFLAASDQLPMAVILFQNRPNPFNPQTTLSFSLPRAGWVELTIIDSRGRIVTTLLDGIAAEGKHDVSWNGRDDADLAVASGVYFARLDVANAAAGVQTVKLVLTR
jgi:hypothetical protein